MLALAVPLHNANLRENRLACRVGFTGSVTCGTGFLPACPLPPDVSNALVGDRGVDNGARDRAMAHECLQRPARGRSILTPRGRRPSTAALTGANSQSPPFCLKKSFSVLQNGGAEALRTIHRSADLCRQRSAP